MTGGLGVVGSNPAAPTKKPLQNKRFLNFGRLDRDHEMRTKRLQGASTGAQSPEIFPKCVLRMFTAGVEVRHARTA